MVLSEIIKQRIKSEGPLPFCSFMEMALYYPGLGYYTSDKEKIGEHGDFYTSAYLTATFGAMIAKQIEEMWIMLDKKPFTIVEFGAGTGLLCLDILNELKNNPELYKDLSYTIIEKSPAMREIEKTCLTGQKVNWKKSVEDVGPVNGCILSNEVLDNFSVHRIVMQDELMEVFVGYKDGFIELLQPASGEIKNYLAELHVELPKGFCTEVNLQAIKWIRDVSQLLSKGFVLTIDYGHPSAELYCMQRKAGTILCYHKHRTNENLYSAIGEQDITSQVNFSALSYWGAKYGLQCCGYTNQARFLMSLGLTEYIRKQEDDRINSGLPQQSIPLQAFLMEMGSNIKVLIQQKGLQNPRLSGLKLAGKVV